MHTVGGYISRSLSGSRVLTRVFSGRGFALLCTSFCHVVLPLIASSFVDSQVRAIEEANEQIDILKADIEKYTSDAAQLTKEIAAHEEDISVWTGDSKAATKVRKIEKADYDTTNTHTLQ